MIADDIRALREQAAEHEELLDLIAATLKTHADRISALDAGGGAGGPADAPGPADVDWRSLDAAAATRTWVELLDWAEWLAATFPVADVLPACWAWHPALLWDVSALYLAQVASYAPGANPGAPLAWIEQLERAFQRWRLWDQAQCAASGRHRADHTPMRWPDDWRAGAQEAAADDVASRPEPETAPDADTEGLA